MSGRVLLLLLLSAVLHAGWNLLLKRSAERFVFTWLAMAVSAALASPVLFLMDFRLSGPAAICLLASAAAEAAYFMALSRAYAAGDLSIVYPLARGSAPLYILAWSHWLLGERLRGWGWLGLGLVVLGIFLISARRPGEMLRPLRALRPRAAGWALLAGFCTSVYSLADKLGVALVPPPVFITLSFGLTAVVLTPFVLRRRGRAGVWSDVRRSGPAMVAGGLLVTAAYLMVLYAMTQADLSRVGAAREVSIVFGALAGWLLLKEGFGPLRTGAAALVFAGVFLISLR